MPMNLRVRRRLKLRELDTLLAVALCGSMLKASFKVLPFECPIQPPPVGILTWKGR
jgi:hypothetical protein